MKNVALLLLLALPANAAGPLAFSGRIQNEALAEEAIDLLHCLADEFELSWELKEENGAAFSLRLEEKGGHLEGFFRSPIGKKEIQFGLGEAKKTCAQLSEAKETNTSPSEAILPVGNWEPEESKPRWLWVAAGAALLAGGFLLWKSRPDHRAFKME